MKYKTNKIAKFIFRLDFASEIEELKSNMPNNIAEKIKISFPIFNQRNLTETSVTVKENELSKEDKQIIEWSYTDKEEKNKIIISSRYIIFDSILYMSFDDVNQKFTEVIEEILKLNNVQICRTGIRYVNIFKPSEFNIKNNLDWKELFKSELFKYEIFGDLQYSIAQTIDTIDIYKGNYMIKLKTGFKNNQYPIVKDLYDFVIDCDGYSMSVITNISELKETIEDIHSNIETVFESCIKEKMREKLNG